MIRQRKPPNPEAFFIILHFQSPVTVYQSMKFKKLFFPALFFFTFSLSYAQDEDIFGISDKAKNPKSESAVGNVTRNLLEMFSLEISGGAAYHQTKMPFYTETPSLYPFNQVKNFDNQLVLKDEIPLDMKGSDWAFPLNAGLRINLFNTLTIGGGYGREWGSISPLDGGDHEFTFEGSSYQVSKLYGTVGLVLYDARKRAKFLKWRYRKYASANLYMQSELRQRVKQNYPWRFIAEGEFGQLDLIESFDPRVALVDEPYYGFGLRIEREFSEYAKFFIKGGAEFRKFTFAASDFSESQNMDQNVYALQLGMAMTLPGTKKCKIQGCGVVMKHMHNGIEYRGSSIFKFQNRKVGQWY